MVTPVSWQSQNWEHFSLSLSGCHYLREAVLEIPSSVWQPCRAPLCCPSQLSQLQQMLGSGPLCPQLMQTPGLAVPAHLQASNLLTLEAADGG